jgi:hypothetical protein
MCRLLLSSTIIVLLGTATARAADEAQAIVQKAIQALGGDPQLRQARGVKLQIKGVVQELDNAAFSGEVLSQYPSQFKAVLRVETNNVQLSMIQVLNATKAWIRINGSNQEMDAATHADMEQSAYVDSVTSLWPLLQEKNFTLSLAGETKVQDRPVLGVKVSAKGRPDITLYFDKDNGLLVKTVYRRQDATLGKEVLREDYYSDYREVNPTRAAEQTLQAARMAPDTPALLEFLRQHTVDEARLEKVRSLVRKLGDDSFEVRESAKKDLIAQGAVAAALLGQAVSDPDPEIATRAKECLQRIGKPPDSSLSIAVVQLVARHRPPGAAKVLLAYLGSAPDAAVAQEVRGALRSVAYREGKPDPALLKALNGTEAQRRAAAAALGRDGKEIAGQRLFPRGLKRAMKEVQFRDGKKIAEWEVRDVQLFNKFDDSVFAEP